MNIAIVDDSSDDRSQLSGNIRKYANEYTMQVHLMEYDSGEAFLGGTALLGLDVAFLDIYMGELSGMDVARTLRGINSSCLIVFETSTPDFAVKSYEVRAFHYLLKPFGYTEICDVMNLLDKNTRKSSRYIKIKEGREWTRIFLSDILYIDYSNHYVQFHTECAIISSYMKFPEVQAMLAEYLEFLCCYRCIIINMDKVKKAEELFFLMCNGEYIPINRKNVKDIKSRYMDYVFGVIESGKRDFLMQT